LVHAQLHRLMRDVLGWRQEAPIGDGHAQFLHAWVENTPAISLYASLGYARRATMNFVVIAVES